jgi:hypothetical protein
VGPLWVQRAADASRILKTDDGVILTYLLSNYAEVPGQETSGVFSRNHRKPALGAGGRWFESSRPDQIARKSLQNRPVRPSHPHAASLRASASGLPRIRSETSGGAIPSASAARRWAQPLPSITCANHPASSAFARRSAALGRPRSSKYIAGWRPGPSRTRRATARGATAAAGEEHDDAHEACRGGKAPAAPVGTPSPTSTPRPCRTFRSRVTLTWGLVQAATAFPPRRRRRAAERGGRRGTAGQAGRSGSNQFHAPIARTTLERLVRVLGLRLAGA